MSTSSNKMPKATESLPTMDDWSPTVRPKKSVVVPQSDWRYTQNDGNNNQKPGLSDLRKIEGYLNKKAPDHEIMEAFGLTADTLVAIKRGCYDPVSGISLDNQSKIYEKFKAMDLKMEKAYEALKFIGLHVLGRDDVLAMKYKAIIARPPKKRKGYFAGDEEEE